MKDQEEIEDRVCIEILIQDNQILANILMKINHLSINLQPKAEDPKYQNK